MSNWNIYRGMAGKKAAQKQEKKVAEQVGGKTTPNSGATLFKKGDVTADNMVIECKTSTTVRNSFSIKREWLDKLQEEAIAVGKDFGVLAIDYGDGEQYYVMPEREFTALFGDSVDRHVYGERKAAKVQKSLSVSRKKFQEVEAEAEGDQIPVLKLDFGDGKKFYMVGETDLMAIW